MLQTIRDRSKGVIAAVIVFLISLTFVLWGVQSYIDAGSKVVVAEAGGEEILLSEFQESLQRIRRQAQSVLGDSFDGNSWDSAEIKQRALDELVDERILGQVIDDARIRVGDVQVARQLQQIPSFQTDGSFSRELYVQRVPLLGLTPAGFEQKLREDMARAQLRAGIAASEFVTAQEAENIQRLRAQRRDIGYATIPASEFDDQVLVTDEEIVAYFGKHREAFRRAEKVKLEYLVISAPALASEVPVSDDLLREYYDANQATYTVDEERNVNHILIQAREGAGAEDEVAAMEKIANVFARAKAGEVFEELAQELSDDVGSSADGGETGFFGRGVMASEFEQAAFDLEEGEISDPVKTKFGFHIIKLKAIKAGGLRIFDEVRAEVEVAYRDVEAQKLFLEQAEQFSNLVYERPDGLEAAADALSLSVSETAALTKIEIAALFSDRVAAAAFETEVLLEGLNAEPIELADGRVVAVRVNEHQPSSVPPLAEVRREIKEAVTTDKKRLLTEAAGKAMIERLRDGETVTELVKGGGFGWESVEAASRESNDVNRAVLRAAFRIEGDDDGPIYAGVAIGKSDYAVLRVANVTTPAPEELDKSDVVDVQRELVTARAETTWREFLDALRSKSDVQIFHNRL